MPGFPSTTAMAGLRHAPPSPVSGGYVTEDAARCGTSADGAWRKSRGWRPLPAPAMPLATWSGVGDRRNRDKICGEKWPAGHWFRSISSGAAVSVIDTFATKTPKTREAGTAWRSPSMPLRSRRQRRGSTELRQNLRQQSVANHRKYNKKGVGRGVGDRHLYDKNAKTAGTGAAWQ